MKKEHAVALVRSLLERIETGGDGWGRLEGRISASEIRALQALAADTDSAGSSGEEDNHETATQTESPATDPPREPISDAASEGTIGIELELDLSSTEGVPEENVRICIDFGTAMSKATLVVDEHAGRQEQIDVLELGIPGNQEEISRTMLVSSVLLDGSGRLWFGQEAVDRSLDETLSGSASRIDNIKRRISEGGLRDPVSADFNPKGVQVSYEDLIIAYLTFLTFCINDRLRELGYDGNVLRRYASPCLEPESTANVETFMQEALLIAQIAVDTLGRDVCKGLDVDTFLDLISRIRSAGVEARFVGERISEPAGVMGATISWHGEIDALMMVIDVGAGTSDFGLFRVRFDPHTNGPASVYTIKDTPRAIRAAGNHLDQILREHAVMKGGVANDTRIRRRLERNIREYKEILFNDEVVTMVLSEDDDLYVDVSLEEFLELSQVKQFSDRLRQTMEDVFLEDRKWADWFSSNLDKRLIIVLTGGGSELPMVKELASRDLTVDGRTIPVARSRAFPAWLAESHPHHADDFARISVSLGGARKRIFDREGKMRSAPLSERETFRIDRY